MKKELRESKYQWDASDYANHSTVQQKWAKELLGKLNLNPLFFSNITKL